MERTHATKLLRLELDKAQLHAWKIRLTNDLTKPFLGMCSYKDKTIILNAHHIDTHPDVEVINTIRHEVAHALTPGAGHNDVWAAKARELGCDNTMACASYSFSPAAIDAIRSGADLEVEFTEEVQVIRKPKYTISRLQDKCPECGKVAKATSVFTSKTSSGRKKFTILECNHTIITDADSTSPFEELIFDEDKSCKHVWGKGIYYTFCTKCTGRRLYPFQIEGAQAIEAANGRFAILDDQGLGKTMQATAYLKYHKHDAWPFLWVTGAGTVYQHAKEIVRVMGYDAIPQIIQGGKSIVIPTLNAVISYDSFRRMDLSQFESFKCIVLDEVQKIKNPDSSRTQCVRKVAKNMSKIIPTSATFWKNRGSEAFVMLNLLDPTRFYSYDGFKRTQVTEYWDGSKMKEGGLKKGFIKEISDIAIRRERSVVMPELPLINRTRIICEMPAHAKAVLKQEEEKLVKEYNDHLIDGTEESFAANAAVMASLMVMRQIVGIAKILNTVEYVKEFLEETDRKIVVFVHHIKCGELILHQLHEYCGENDFPKPLQINAAMSPYERNRVAEEFNGPNHRILIASTLASGEGLNLQTCSDCVMHERQWNPANEEQAEGRFIRIGQQAQSVNAVYMHGDGTVDMDLHGIVEPKRIQFHNSMNGTEMAQWNQANVIADLVKAIAARHKKGKK